MLYIFSAILQSDDQTLELFDGFNLFLPQWFPLYLASFQPLVQDTQIISWPINIWKQIEVCSQTNKHETF